MEMILLAMHIAFIIIITHAYASAFANGNGWLTVLSGFAIFANVYWAIYWSIKLI
jgi:hypothetical protein